MDVKKFIFIICVLIATPFIAEIIININSAEIEELSEPVIIPASETISPQVEPIIETTPEDDYIFYDVPLDLDTQKEIINICSEYDISYELILGMISVESTFRPGVLGDGGNSFGLMQIQPRWWSETMTREGVTDLLDPLQNVRCGCAIMRELIDKYDTEYRALQAYNTGRPDSNNGYADKVFNYVDNLIILEVNL